MLRSVSEIYSSNTQPATTRGQRQETMEDRLSSRPFDETEDEEEGLEVVASTSSSYVTSQQTSTTTNTRSASPKDANSITHSDSVKNVHINPFAYRQGKTLSWRGVNMTVVSLFFGMD